MLPACYAMVFFSTSFLAVLGSNLGPDVCKASSLPLSYSPSSTLQPVFKLLILK